MVSVIIPHYNRIDYLEKAIDSVLIQTLSDLEIFVIDDGSSADVRKSLEKLKQKDLRIHILLIDHTGKPAAARNYGIKHSHGDIIAFLDSDDEWHPEKLKTQLAFIGQGYDIIGSNFSNENDYSISVLKASDVGKVTKGKLILNNNICNSSVIMKRSVVDSIGYQDESRALYEDYDYWIRALFNGKSAYIQKDCLVYYRVHQGMISSKNNEIDKRLNYLLAIFSKITDYSYSEKIAIRLDNEIVNFYDVMINKALKKKDRKKAWFYLKQIINRDRKIFKKIKRFF